MRTQTLKCSLVLILMASFLAVTILPGWFNAPHVAFAPAGMLVALAVSLLWHVTPNGVPRPERDLPVGKVLQVIMMSDSYFGIRYVGLRDVWCLSKEAAFWHFSSLPKEVVTGCEIVYLDNPHLFLKDWADQKIVMVLSEKGRAIVADESVASTSKVVRQVA